MAQRKVCWQRVSYLAEAVLVSAGLSAIPCGLNAAETKSNVIIITVDTLRADHLGCYGDQRIRTPNIDAQARGSARFTRAFTPVPITLPAHAALFTGSYPMGTGIHDFIGNKLSSDAVTLGKVLHERGYATAAFIGAAVLDSRFGLDQGFETYFDQFDFSRVDDNTLDRLERRGDRVMDEALKWLKQNPRRPFLLWVHLYDPHFPYAAPEPFASQYRSLPYDGEIAFADAQVGRLLSSPEAHSISQNSIIVLASDHGESLGEHGEKKHGYFIYNSTLHVPLLIKVPGVAPRVIKDDVSLVDVMPTVLQALRIPIPPTVQGRSLLSAMRGSSGAAASNLYSETYLPLLHFRWSQLRGLEWRGLKYIEAPQPELYDTRADPGETSNLLKSRQADAQAMHERLLTLLRRYTPASGGGAKEKELTDPALAERLRSLGYVAISAGTYAESSGEKLPDPKDRIHVYELFWEAMDDGEHGRYQESLRKLHEAETIEPDSLPIQYLAGLSYFRMQNYAQAIPVFRKALEINPKFTSAWYFMGVSQTKVANYDAAIENLSKALELDPENSSAAFALGAACLRVKRVDEAARAFELAIRVNPDYAEAHTALGEIYLYEKRLDDAVRVLERAVRLAPGLPEAHYRLGQAYQAKGLEEQAEQEFRRAKSP